MRMYRGKKVLEWSDTPATAHETLAYLNDRYALDGSDPNSYANIGWIFGLHDRRHGEREIYGKVRCMTEFGLRKKFGDRINKYVESVHVPTASPMPVLQTA